MDSLQFAYWLQGFAELNNGVPPNETQWKAIRDHLNLIFKKTTPNYPGFGTYTNKDNFKDFTPAATPVYFNPDKQTLSPWPYTITCARTGTSTNNQSMSIC